MIEDVDSRLFWTPAAIEALRTQTDGEMSATLTEAVAGWSRGAISGTLFNPFRAFVADWQNYSANVGTLGTLWGSTAVTIEGYRTKLVDWRKQLSAAGIAFTTPDPRISDSFVSPTTMKWALAIAGVAVAAYAISKVTDLGKLVRA
jgi:hypothetical protein